MVKELKAEVPAGTYVVAVSGGVDSMVLLHLLQKRPDLKLIVAHANHGQRSDVAEDEALVRNYAMSHNLTYETTELNLELHASEARARRARYNFLQNCRIKYKAASIITAHHQDDLIETVIINLLRGTGWRGLAPFMARPDLRRPLLTYTKNEILAYAQQHGVAWREDTTNTDIAYLRNYVRRVVIPRCNKIDREWCIDFLQLIRNQQTLRRTITSEIEKYQSLVVQVKGSSLVLDRYQLIMAPSPIAYELLQSLCRQYIGHTLERPLAESLLMFCKVGQTGKYMPINNLWHCRATKRQIIVEASRPW